MKGKKTTYLLIFGVIAVWGIIFYRIFVAVTEETAVPIAPSPKKSAYFQEVDHQRDSVKLELNYRDPFSVAGYVHEVKEAKPAIAAEHTTMVVPQPQPVNWSTIIYKGYVANPSTKQRLAIVQVSGTDALLAEGQSANGMKLLKNFGDSIRVRYRNSIKNIRIN